MGGRRGRSIRDIVGLGNRGLKGKLTQAVDEKNPEKIAYYSSELISKSPPEGKSIVVAFEFMNIISKRADELKELQEEERIKEVTRIWTKLKKEKKLQFKYNYVDSIYINSALEALEGGRDGE